MFSTGENLLLALIKGLLPFLFDMHLLSCQENGNPGKALPCVEGSAVTIHPFISRGLGEVVEPHGLSLCSSVL